MDAEIVREFVARESLPAVYGEDALRYFAPLAERLARLAAESPRPPLIGLNGAQGTGKTTLAKLLARLLRARGLTVADLSLDDFYLRAGERQILADTEHALLRTRGVPGTHDTALLSDTLDRLMQGAAGQTVRLPVFDKALDDRREPPAWRSIEGPVDAVLLEGWCIGAAPEAPEALQQPVNELERREDPDGSWRQYVNRQLAGPYESLFGRLDRLIVLQAPSLQQVREWRGLQEHKLAQRLAEGGSPPGAAPMDQVRLDRFLQHYERLTRHCLESLPERADVVCVLDVHHRIVQVTGLDGPGTGD